MFDTNIFNDIVKKSIDINTFQENITYYATNVQWSELNATTDIQLREKLKAMFSRLETFKLPTESFCFDRSQLDIDKLGDGVLYTKIKKFIDELNKKKAKKKEGNGNTPDALIAETSIQNNITLVTHDKELFKAITEFEGSAVNLYYILNDSSRNK